MSAIKASLSATLRNRLGDDRPTVPAFSVELKGAESALMELSGGVLSVQVMRGTAQSVRFPLSAPDYSTVGRLATALAKTPGYTVVMDVSISNDHSSFDLSVEGGIVDISKGPYVLKHRMFSEADLDSLITEAATLHNPNYSTGRVPPAEQAWVLMKAQAKAYQVLAAQAAMKPGQAENSAALLSLARELDRQYASDSRKHARVLPKAKTDESKIGSGDIIVGTLTRADPRTGLMAPVRGAQNADPPVLLEPASQAVTDTTVTLKWKQNREDWFGKFELWRDVFPEVEATPAGRPDISGIQEDDGSRGTSVLVWSANVNANLEKNVATDDGENHPLEPDMTYYYRLYTYTVNGDFLPSNVVRVQTKELRARFLRAANGTLGAWADVVSGLGGTEVVFTGAGFHDGMQVLVGGKPVVDLAIVSPTEATATIPIFQNPATIGVALDVVLLSLSGLSDVLKGAWRYVA